MSTRPSTIQQLLIAPAALILLFSVSCVAHAERRLALLIGNSAYQHTRALPNARNDVEAIAKVLRDIDFSVTIKLDQTYAELRRSLREFGEAADSADIALIHFAGHGLEVGGENYLLPVDARLAKDSDLEFEAVTLNSLLNAVRRATKLKLVILDACRNNPLSNKMALSSGTMRTVSRGLARIEPSGDVLVAYSAKAGTVAEDGVVGSLSPFAAALVNHLSTPGLDLRLMFGRVRDTVREMTGNRQEPFTYGSLRGETVALVPAKPGKLLAEAERRSSNHNVNSPKRPDAYPVVQAKGLFNEQNAERVQALADKHGFRLPDYQIDVPDADVPLNVRRFLGVWVDETGGEAKAKKFMFIITQVTKNGDADGYMLDGPPTPTSFSKNAPGILKIAGRVTGDTLRFSDPTANYRLRLRHKPELEYHSSLKTGQNFFRLLKPVWLLVEAERQSKPR